MNETPIIASNIAYARGYMYAKGYTGDVYLIAENQKGVIEITVSCPTTLNRDNFKIETKVTAKYDPYRNGHTIAEFLDELMKQCNKE